MNAPAAGLVRRLRAAPVRFALRDLRGGLKGLRVFLLSIALGVAAIVGVESLARALDDGLGREGRVILGGDASFSLIHRRLSAGERGFLEAHGSLSTIATMRGMARTASGDAALIEIKAVEPSWPRLGAAVLAPPIALDQALGEKDGAFGAAVEEALLARLSLKLGDIIRIGQANFAVRAVLVSEPDRLATGIGLGPRVLISQAALEATKLIEPGSLVRWTTRVVMHGPRRRAERRGRPGSHGRGEASLPSRRMGRALAARGVAGFQPRPRPLRRISRAGRIAVARCRRGRRRQRGAGLRRAQALDARDSQGDRRDGNWRRHACADRISDRRADWRARRRRARLGDSVSGRLAVRRSSADPARADDCTRNHRTWPDLRSPDGRGFLGSLARARARSAGDDADPRHDRGTPGLASPALSWPCGARRSGARGARGPGEPATVDRGDGRRSDGLGVSCAARRRLRHCFPRAPCAPHSLGRVAHGARRDPQGRRADAHHHAVARPWPHRAHRADPHRLQHARRVARGSARSDAELLLPRCARAGRAIFRRLPQARSPGRQDQRDADVARAVRRHRWPAG